LLDLYLAIKSAVVFTREESEQILIAHFKDKVVILVFVAAILEWRYD
jgi:hypothetical protein